MKKSVLLLVVLALTSLSIAYAKNFNVDLSHNMQAGDVQLKAGAYHLTVDGDKAIFTEVNTSKQFTVPVKIETAAKKFEYTRIDETSGGNVNTLKSIQLGGSTSQLNF